MGLGVISTLLLGDCIERMRELSEASVARMGKVMRAET